MFPTSSKNTLLVYLTQVKVRPLGWPSNFHQLLCLKIEWSNCSASFRSSCNVVTVLSCSDPKAGVCLPPPESLVWIRELYLPLLLLIAQTLLSAQATSSWRPIITNYIFIASPIRKHFNCGLSLQ